MQFFIRTLTTAVLAFVCQTVAGDSLLQVDSRALVSRSDLIYLRPANGPGEGQPIGNGVMAPLVWTTPVAT